MEMFAFVIHFCTLLWATMAIFVELSCDTKLNNELSKKEAEHS